MEKARHVLLLREKLLEQDRTAELSKLDKEAVNKYRRQSLATSATSDLSAKERQRTSTDMEKSMDDLQGVLDNVDVTSSDPSTGLIVKCLKLLLASRRLTRARLLSVVSVSCIRLVSK